MNPKRIVAATLVAGFAVFAAAGCSTEARAERKGKQFGDQVCKMKDSDSVDEAERHLRKADDKLDDLARFVGRDVAEDLVDIDRNLDQLVRDVSKGKDVRQQDVNAILRSVEEAKASASGAAEAAYDGMIQGLSDCN